jgi:hypothetical protein
MLTFYYVSHYAVSLYWFCEVKPGILNLLWTYILNPPLIFNLLLKMVFLWLKHVGSIIVIISKNGISYIYLHGDSHIRIRLRFLVLCLVVLCCVVLCCVVLCCVVLCCVVFRPLLASESVYKFCERICWFRINSEWEQYRAEEIVE